MDANLKVADIAKIAKCHRNTVLNYERKGIIQSCRTINGHRRFSQEDAEKLKRILSARWPGNDDN